MSRDVPAHEVGEVLRLELAQAGHVLLQNHAAEKRAVALGVAVERDALAVGRRLPLHLDLEVKE